MIKELLKLGVKTKIVSQRMLIYYETIDIIKYLQLICFHKEIFLLHITKLTALKVIVLLLVLI